MAPPAAQDKCQIIIFHKPLNSKVLCQAAEFTPTHHIQQLEPGNANHKVGGKELLSQPTPLLCWTRCLPEMAREMLGSRFSSSGGCSTSSLNLTRLPRFGGLP